MIIGHVPRSTLFPYTTLFRSLVDELGGPPDALALPYGGGGNTRAYFRGFSEAGAGLPRFVLGQADDRAHTLASAIRRSEEHTSELQSHSDLVCRLLLEKKNHK